MNPKLLAPLCVLLLLATGVMGWKLRDAQARYDALASRHQALLAAQQSDQERLSDLQKKADAYADTIAQMQARRGTRTGDVETPAGTNGNLAARNWMNDPANRQRMQEWAARGLDRQYGEWLESLGLPPEQLEKLKGLMTSAQGRMFELGRQMMNANGDTNAIAQALAAYQAQRVSDQTALQALLGDKYQTLAAYEKTKPVTDALERIQRDLATGTAPLLPDQSRQLYALLEREAASGTVFNGGGGGGRGAGRWNPLTSATSTSPFASVDPIGTIDQRVKAQTDANQRILNSSAAFLNQEQLAGLREQLDAQVQSLQRSKEWTQRMLSGERPGGGGPPPEL